MPQHQPTQAVEAAAGAVWYHRTVGVKCKQRLARHTIYNIAALWMLNASIVWLTAASTQHCGTANASIVWFTMASTQHCGTTQVVLNIEQEGSSSESKVSERRTTSEAVRTVLSRSRLKVWWVSAAQDTLLVVAVVLGAALCIEPSSVLKVFPPGLYTAIVTDAKFEVAWVVVAIAAVVRVANVVAVVTRCRACSVVFEVSGTVLWGLFLRLRYRVRITVIHARSYSFWLLCL